MGIGKIHNQFCGEHHEKYTKRSPAATNLQLRRNLEFTLTFRVTGEASVARLEPLLLDQDWSQRMRIAWFRANDEGSGGEGHDDGASIDFVWETIATKNQRAQHRRAAVLNRLSGAQVLQSPNQTFHEKQKKQFTYLPSMQPFNLSLVLQKSHYGILGNPWTDRLGVSTFPFSQ